MTSILNNAFTEQEEQKTASLPPASAPSHAEQVMSDENLEQVIISTLMTDPTLSVLSSLEEKDFGIPAMRSVFRAISALHERRIPVDVVSLWGELDARRDTETVQSIENLHSLTQPRAYIEDTHGRFSTYAELLKQRSTRKEYLRISDHLNKQILRGQHEGQATEDLRELFSKAESAANRLTSDEEVETMADTTDRIMDFYQNGDSTKRIPTGVKSLDAMLNGGFLPGKVITIGANSGYGKSVLGLQIALNSSMARNERTVFFSLEMGREEVIHRANAAMCQIPFQVLTSNRADPTSHQRLLDDYEYEHLGQNMARLNSGTLDVQDGSRLSTPTLRSVLSRAQSEGSPYRMVVLDYLAQMEADRRQDDERLKINAIMEDLKRIAKDYDTTIVLLAQTQRDMENAPVKDAKMNSLRGSGGIENASDIILLIGKVDSVEFPTAEIDPERFRAIKVMKNRMGTPGKTINVEFEGMYMRFCDLDAKPAEKLEAVGSHLNHESVLRDNDHPNFSYTDLPRDTDAREQLSEEDSWAW